MQIIYRHMLQKFYRFLFWLQRILIGLVLFCLVACHPESKKPSAEAIELLSYEAQFDYTLRNLLRSNKTEKVTSMLEMRALLNLEEVWQIAGKQGISTNGACNQAFYEVYPILRKEVPLERFHNLIQPQRQSLADFFEAADQLILATNK